MFQIAMLFLESEVEFIFFFLHTLQKSKKISAKILSIPQVKTQFFSANYGNLKIFSAYLVCKYAPFPPLLKISRHSKILLAVCVCLDIYQVSKVNN